MKKTNLILMFSLLLSSVIFAQESDDAFEPSGSAFGKVFFNYHYDATQDATQRNTFELQRAYLGYKYSFSDAISATITLDGSRESDASAYTAFLKIAQLDWKVASPVKLSVGLIGLKQFDTQEKFWGYRYIFKSFQDEFALGSSADLGANAEIKLAKTLKANLFVLNGEGYSKLQDDMGRMKVGGNLIFEPVKGLTIKGYYDNYGGNVELYPDSDSSRIVKDTVSVQTIGFFVGYGTDKFRIGAEYNLQLNGKKYNEIAADHNLTGIALYGTYVINKKFEVFAEWLNFKSNKLSGATETWNYNKDGNILIAGLQYTPVKGVKTALNYRTFLYNNSDLKTKSLVYLNFEFAF
jgi:hypothetical protein